MLSHLCNIRGQSSSFLFKLKNIVFLMIFWNFLGLETLSNFKIFKRKNIWPPSLECLKANCNLTFNFSAW